MSHDMIRLHTDEKADEKPETKPNEYDAIISSKRRKTTADEQNCVFQSIDDIKSVIVRLSHSRDELRKNFLEENRKRKQPAMDTRAREKEIHDDLASLPPIYQNRILRERFARLQSSKHAEETKLTSTACMKDGFKCSEIEKQIRATYRGCDEQLVQIIDYCSDKLLEVTKRVAESIRISMRRREDVMQRDMKLKKEIWNMKHDRTKSIRSFEDHHRNKLFLFQKQLERDVTDDKFYSRVLIDELQSRLECGEESYEMNAKNVLLTELEKKEVKELSLGTKCSPSLQIIISLVKDIRYLTGVVENLWSRGDHDDEVDENSTDRTMIKTDVIDFATIKESVGIMKKYDMMKSLDRKRKKVPGKVSGGNCA